MLKQSSENTTSTQERRSTRVIFYNLSYIVQGAEHGTDGAIVLLHDIIGGATAWRDVLPQLAATNRAVYAIDMLGYGLSDRPWPADTSIWGHADALAFFFNQLNLTDIVLVGHGIGGGVAQVLATRLSSERVAALVLIDTTCYEYSVPPDWPLPDMKKSQDPDVAKQAKVEDMMRELRETVPNGSQNPDRFKEIMEEWIEPWDSELGKELLYQQIRLLLPNYSNSVASDLKVMRKPTLIVWGENDRQIPLKLAQRLHHDIPESRLVIIPGAGHLIVFDAPDQVASALADFVGKLL
ncbi:MAG TPA: alpha/beta hydrolase [Ktedonobacteraceae bacterium]|nr:alpha/beta hydrolase [Ktedonobacteraceae bacterium]